MGMVLPHEPHERMVNVMCCTLCYLLLIPLVVFYVIGCTHSMYYTHAFLCSRPLPWCGCCLYKGSPPRGLCLLFIINLTATTFGVAKFDRRTGGSVP